MPNYVKKYRSKKSYRPKKKSSSSNWYNKKYSVGDMANAALKGVWYLKGLVNSEKYKSDVADTGTIVVNTGAYGTLLTGVATGDGDNQRTGNSIFARSLNIRGQAIYNPLGTNPHFLRVSVVMDLQQIGDTGFSYATVYANGDYNAHLNAVNVGRFKILWTRLYKFDDQNNIAHNFVANIPMRQHLRFNGTASSDVQKDHIYIVASSSEPTNGPKLVWNSRLTYHDN